VAGETRGRAARGAGAASGPVAERPEPADDAALTELVDRALAEDLGAGDVTSEAVVDRALRARARIAQKREGVIAGLEVAARVFERVDPSLRLVPLVEPGRWREDGPVAEVEGTARSLLAAERVALNFLGHLSGVATLTARYVRAVEGTGARILHTRKTMPGLRAPELQAVRLGGGMSHRRGLDDAILLKENHVALAGGLAEAARRAVAAGAGGLEVVVECETLADVEQALAAGAPRVLLDDMTLEEVRQAVTMADGRALVEASGGISLERVAAIAAAGVDLISVGSLTHSAPALDLSMAVERI
jgi:nicotinate-nucleotide pyrophosphorylase (carboxylating)